MASDHLIGRLCSNPVVEPPVDNEMEGPKRLVQYLNQLERVGKLEPDIAFSGHVPPIHDVGRLVKNRLVFYQRRAELVWELLAGGPATVYELAKRLYELDKLPALRQFLALSGVQGYLDLLETLGQVSIVLDSSTTKWVKI